MNDVVSTDTYGADPITNAQQAATWTAQANKLAADDYLVRWKNWLLRKTETNAAAEPEPQAPFIIKWAWVENQGEVMSVGPERVATPPMPPPRITEVGKIDDTVGAEVLPQFPGHFYNLSNSTSPGEPHISRLPTPRFWTLVQAERSFNTYWMEVK